MGCGDPDFRAIHNRRLWHALLIEPLPDYFEQLVKNYGSSHRFKFEQ